MNRQPFSLFAPYRNRIDVRFFVKADGIASDDDVLTATKLPALASAQQVHGNKTVIIREPIKRAEGADGVITDAKNLALSIRVADCQSFVIYEAKSNVIGVLHAGWKGLVNKAIPEFFKSLQSEWHMNPDYTYVGAGPSLCQNCAEFTDPISELPGINPKFFNGRCVDLRGIADAQLMDMGIHKSHIERMPDCTKCKSGMYYSYRGGDRGAVMEGRGNVLVGVLR